MKGEGGEVVKERYATSLPVNSLSWTMVTRTLQTVIQLITHRREEKSTEAEERGRGGEERGGERGEGIVLLPYIHTLFVHHLQSRYP